MTRRQRWALVIVFPVSVILCGLLWAAFTLYNRRKHGKGDKCQ